MTFEQVTEPADLIAMGLKPSLAEEFFASLAPDPSRYIVYCDGACSGNGVKVEAPGGWGAVLISAEKTQVGRAGSKNTTNNKMELLAAIESLKQLPLGVAVTLHTDSQYVIKGCTEWRKGWERNGMRNSSKEPVKNPELWLQLWAEVDKRTVLFRKVKGHAGIPGNEVADKLATMGYMH